jgi:antitoxin ParD1/3/4
MATRNVNLTDTLDAFVEERVRSGDYQNASEVMRAGLRLLKAEEDERAARLASLNAAIQLGIDASERGDFEVVDDVEAWMAARGRRGVD